jgi:hypothetical protein
MSVDMSDFLGTDDVAFIDRWQWVQQLGRAVLQASTRVGLGIMAAGFALAGSTLYTSEAGSRYGGIALGASAVFAVWFAVSAILSGVRGR